MTDWARLRDSLYWERGGKWLKCEVEGCEKFPTDLHHAFVHGMKGFEKHLDVKENLQWVCREHHQSIANSWDNQVYFWGVQCARYGEKQMKKWIKSLPFKGKLENYDQFSDLTS